MQRTRIQVAVQVLSLLLMAHTALAQQNAPAPAATDSVVFKPWTWPALTRSWHFQDNPYYEAVTAQPHAPRVFILAPAWAAEFPHSEARGSRFAWQITLGRDIPLWGRESGVRGPNATMLSEGNWGFGIWAPVSFHMIEDFADESNPIVDTDYRFGGTVKLAYGLKNNTSLNVKFTPWAHESTHLGDEYTIIASRQPTFERVNVSYEYREYGVSITRALQDGASITVRHGGISLWGEDGYYSNHLLGETAATLTPSVHNYEPSFGFEWFAPRSDPLSVTKRQWVVSADLRFRLQYDYHQDPGGDDERRPSLSLTVGRSSRPGSPTALKQYLLYFYRGVNPYGQLRSDDQFWSAGFGWIFQ